MKDQTRKLKVQADNNSIAIGEINISGTVTGGIQIGHTITPLPPAEARLRHDLGILMKNVQTTWIKGVLEKSVHEAALLDLGMELREEAVENPWRMVMEKPDQMREEISKGRKVKDIFDEANRLLLILGEPGSGKTTTLLQLARDLIAEVDDTFTQPVPVILNLSTWTNIQQPLDEWLVLELSNKYRVPKRDGKKWLQDRRILPFLDGLDEVKVENRANCVEKINKLVNDYGFQGLVVCSRIKDYINLNVRLAFYRAIYLQPLTFEQIDEYLDRAGDKLSNLRATLQADSALQEMAQSPLILNIMGLSFQDISSNKLSNFSDDTTKTRTEYLFNTYISRMFNRKAGGQEYNIEQTKQRLSWLAINMKKHSQDVFLFEDLQPSWLIRNWQWVYALTSRTIGWLVLGLLYALPLTLWDSLEFYKDFYFIDILISNLIKLLNIGFIAGVTGGIVGIIDLFGFELFRKLRFTVEIRPSWRAMIFLVMIFLSTRLILIIGEIFSRGLRESDIGIRIGFSEGLWDGALIGLIIGLIIAFRGRSLQSLERDIQSTEALSWSWSKALKGLGISLFLAILSGGLIGLRETSDLFGGLFGFLIGGLIIGPILGLVGTIFYGLNRKIIETKSFPNQGIRLSVRNSCFGGLIGGFVGGLISLLSDLLIGQGGWVVGYIGILIHEESYMFYRAPLSDLLIGGIIGFVGYGGIDVIKHYILRLILIIQGHTPRDYTRFLDKAVDRIFLQKVGGGYRFIHRMLLEHFAEMYEEK